MPNGRSLPRLVLLLLFLGLIWFYTPTLGFGFIWDDPEWFGRVVGQSWLALIKPTADFQFYRPGTMLYNRLFLQADGTFAAPLMHGIQVGWHILNTALLYALAQRLGLRRWMAVAVAGLFALHPFSYQAVAWAAPQQPLAAALQNGAWLAYLATRSSRASAMRNTIFGLSLLLFVLALTVQESTVALAFVPLLFELALRLKSQDWRPVAASWRTPLVYGWRRALAYPLMALLFGLLWLQVPRQQDLTTLGFDGAVVSYLLQGFVYPLWGRPNGYAPDYDISVRLFLVLSIATVTLLWAPAMWQRRGLLATVGLAWAILGVAPALVGLTYSYVSLSPRLLYYAAPGVALLWVCALWPAPGQHRFWKWGNLLLLLAITIQSSWLLANFQQLYRRGTSHLGELVTAVGDENGRTLFLNFPDRYQPKRPPYPLGYWGVTLAPVVVDLGEFPALLTSHAPHTTSRSLPWLDAEARESGPYHIDMRGVIVSPGELYALAADHDAVYISRYRPDGHFELQQAGSLEPGAAPPCQLVQFGGAICLQATNITQRENELQIQLAWSAETAVSLHHTIFTHLGQPEQPPLVQADGDSWRGALPLTNWRPGDLIHEQRTLALPAGVDELVLRVGVYNWVNGERLPATTPAGRPLASYAYTQTIAP